MNNYWIQTPRSNALEDYTHAEAHPVLVEDDCFGRVLHPSENIEPSYWSVYLRNKDGLSDCVADLPSGTAAHALADYLDALIQSLRDAQEPTA
jgi:hypothetical protein